VELKTRDLFAGRLRRRDYVLRKFVVAVVFAFLGTAIRPSKTDVLMSLIVSAIALVGIFLSLAWAARRLHDMDQSGWWSLVLLMPTATIVLASIFLLSARAAQRLHDMSGWWNLVLLVPLLATIVFLITLCVRRGTTGPNRYGPDPRAYEEESPHRLGARSLCPSCGFAYDPSDYNPATPEWKCSSCGQFLTRP
jgi:uncharacterized membrane protein YhaH (DUF805 family)